MSQPIDVLYIAGTGRSGSTLLSRLLGEIEGFVNVGEVSAHFFMKGPPIPCGCGASVAECSFWRNITDPEIRELTHDLFRLRQIPWLPFRLRSRSPAVEPLLRSLQLLYQSIVDRTGARVIVDSSKNPALAHLLSQVPGIRLSVVHLVRAPQAVVSSWRRPKSYLVKGPAWRVARNWMVINLATEVAAKKAYRCWAIRYEDLVKNPRVYVERMAAELLGRPVTCSFLGNRNVTFRVQHVLAGNPDKLERSTLIVEDRKPRLPAASNLLVSLLTYPFNVRYGYVLAGCALLAPLRLPFSSCPFAEQNDIPLSPERTAASSMGRALVDHS
jgi:hypothetical protein